MSLRGMSDEEITNRVTYHAPSGDGIERHASLSAAIHIAICEVDENCPLGREKSLAITKLEEAKFWASAAVARNKATR